MAEKDHKEIDLENPPTVSELNDYIEELDGKINNLMMRVNRAKSDDQVKALKVQIGVLKNTQEEVKQRFNDFIWKKLQHDNQGNLEMKKSFEDVNAVIQEFKKEEDNVNERLKELMMIQFEEDPGDWTDIQSQNVDYASCGEKKCCEFLGATRSGKFKIVEDYHPMMKKRIISALKIQGTKMQEDYFKNEEAPGFEMIPGSASPDDLGVWAHIERLELKMHALVVEGNELLKKDKGDMKKSLTERIKASGEGQEALKAVKDRAVELGTELSFLLVDLVFIMSEREELKAIFQKFKSLLGSVFKDENFMVMNKIIDILEMTDQEMKQLNKEKKESMEESSETMEETELNMSELREESQLDELLIQILKAVLRLEYILMHPRLPDSKMSKKEDVKAGVKQYEEELKGVEMKIKELKESSSFIFGSEDMYRVEFLNRAVQFMVIQFWNQLGESFEKEPKSD